MLASFEPEAEAEVPTNDMTAGYGVSIGGDEERRMVAARGREVGVKVSFWRTRRKDPFSRVQI